MLNADRQKQIDIVLSKLSELPGISKCTQDDFDSTGVNVFFWLKVSLYSGVRPMQFVVPLRQQRRNLEKAFKELGIKFRVIDYPKMNYKYNSVHDRFETAKCADKYTLIRSDPVRSKIGYDQSRYGIEVFV
jgi:hypothetical protein